MPTADASRPPPPPGRRRGRPGAPGQAQGAGRWGWGVSRPLVSLFRPPRPTLALQTVAAVALADTHGVLLRSKGDVRQWEGREGVERGQRRGARQPPSPPSPSRQGDACKSLPPLLSPLLVLAREALRELNPEVTRGRPGTRGPLRPHCIFQQSCHASSAGRSRPAARARRGGRGVRHPRPRLCARQRGGGGAERGRGVSRVRRRAVYTPSLPLPFSFVPSPPAFPTVLGSISVVNRSLV